MLRRLAIRRFAIIREVEIDFSPGFTVITGETGAGKSILVDALGLILGARADRGLVADGAEQAEIEAVFGIDPESLPQDWLEAQALAEGDELIIRRVLNAPSGSRAWINGRSVTIGQLAELGALLIEIHGQHEHQQLEKPAIQRRLLDRQVDATLLDQLAAAHARWLEARCELNEFERQAGDPDQLELLRFQARELDDLALAEGEYEALEQEQERLARSDDIRAALATATSALGGEDGPNARDLLQRAVTALESLRSLDSSFDEAGGMLDEARINLDESLASLDRLSDDGQGDPERLEQVNRRLEKCLDLARKHRVEAATLPALSKQLNARLENLENQSQKRSEHRAALDAAEADWQHLAVALSAARIQAAKALSRQIEARLAELGMDSGRLEFSVQPADAAEPSAHGKDRVIIQFSANPGQALQPLARIASGGELSRVALALMIAADREESTKTRIFDEVDAGVGGETARVVGRFLREVAGAGQAMCVTHLAQVAACADQQIRVVKTRSDGGTDLRVERLDEAGRRGEIARMLGSAESEKSLDHAAELLEQSDLASRSGSG